MCISLFEKIFKHFINITLYKNNFFFITDDEKLLKTISKNINTNIPHISCSSIYKKFANGKSDI